MAGKTQVGAVSTAAISTQLNWLVEVNAKSFEMDSKQVGVLDESQG